MPEIKILDEQTIDQIAAGEVVERPSSVVKELVENAIDAKATAITIEIKEGGISLIRITDNGQGIPKEQVPTAFLRHATSKLSCMEDLLTISSLGFRGEALSSIASVAQVELITKTASELSGTKYTIEGSKEISLEEVGAPEGTTFLVRNLFYNTPARRKFLKSAQTEASYISTLAERLALSHPGISFQLIVNNQPKLHTNGNTQLKDIIYHIFGRDIAAGVLPVHTECSLFRVDGFIGKPFISRGNRNFETYFINGRYIKSTLITKCLEDAYKPFLMKHQYPFTVLQITMDSDLIDVNVHPAKMEIRFRQGEEIYAQLTKIIRAALEHKDMIQEVPPVEEKAKKKTAETAAERRPEPFEKKRLEAIAQSVKKDSPYERKYQQQQTKKYTDSSQPFPDQKQQPSPYTGQTAENATAGQTLQNPCTGQTAENAPAGQTLQNSPCAGQTAENATSGQTLQGSQYAGQNTENAAAGQTLQGSQYTRQNVENTTAGQTPQDKYSANTYASGQSGQPHGSYASQQPVYEQLSISDSGHYHADFIQEAKRRNYTVIGQLFDTYWLVQVEDELFMIDQHAAHEKVLYERMMAQLADHTFTSQQISPPVIITMTMQEQELFLKYKEQFLKTGFEVHAFGGREYAICAVPANLYNLDQKELFLEMLDGLSHENGKQTPDLILQKIASMSCKAAVKGSQRLSRAEAEHLLSDLLELDNPYHCPHGRPTIIAMSKTEIERKFKRIVS